jgi:hypothetical protein
MPDLPAIATLSAALRLVAVRVYQSVSAPVLATAVLIGLLLVGLGVAGVLWRHTILGNYRRWQTSAAAAAPLDWRIRLALIPPILGGLFMFYRSFGLPATVLYCAGMGAWIAARFKRTH